MNNKNIMGPQKYVLETLTWTIIAMIWYRSIFFMTLPGITTLWSKVLLWLDVISFVLLGSALTFQNRRNDLSLMVNTVIPFALYTVIAYSPLIPQFVWGAVIFSVIASSGYILLVIISNRGLSQRNRQAYIRCLKHGLMGARTIIAVCMLFLLVPLGLKIVFGHGMLDTAVRPVKNAAEADEWTVKYNIDTVRLLREDEWSRLSPQAKMDVLGVVLNIEIRYLGLNHELYLKSALLDDNTAAYYSHNNHEILIDINELQFAPAEETLDSLCHECYHAYQHQMIALYNDTPEEYRNMLLFQDVDGYIEEFSDYADDSENCDDYYTQTVEITARQYATQSVETYYSLIEEYAASDE